jgi:hypothetical protein
MVKSDSRTQLPAVSTVKILSSVILTVFILFDFFSGDYVNIAKTRGDAEEEEDVKEQVLRAKPLIELEPEIDPDGDSQGERNPHAGNQPQGSYQGLFVLIHQAFLNPAEPTIETLAKYHVSRTDVNPNLKRKRPRAHGFLLASCRWALVRFV